MNDPIAELIRKELQAEADAQIARRRAELRVGLEHGRVVFEAELLRRHRELKTALSTYLWNANPLIIITAPVIYAMIMPFILLDLFVALKVNLGSRNSPLMLGTL